MLLRDGPLKFKDASGARGRVGESGELKHLRDVRLVFRAELDHARTVGEIVVAIRKLQTSLQKIGGVMIGVVEAGSDPEAEDVCGMEVGIVEGVDIGAEREAESVGEFAL